MTYHLLYEFLTDILFNKILKNEGIVFLKF